MNHIINTKIIQESIKHYGVENQSTVCMEECAELIQAISKAKRGKLDTENMTEEIADVLICIEMLKKIYDLQDCDIENWIDKKQCREKDRMPDETGDLVLETNDLVIEQSHRVTKKIGSGAKKVITKEEIQRMLDEWNTLEELGVAPVKRMRLTSKRCNALKARIRQNGTEDILEAIENIRHSSFLLGQNKKNWMITFDWFVMPSNFEKVFDGNYLDKAGVKKNQSYMEAVQNRVKEVDNWV